MKTYFNNLNEKEKWMLIGAGICVFFYGYYLILYAPISNKVHQKSTQLIEKQQTLTWMKQIRPQNNLLSKKQTIDNGQLLTILAEQLKENASLKFPYQLQQNNSGDIELSFNEAPFTVFLAWLVDLEKQYSIRIKQFDAAQTKTPGLAKMVLIVNATK